MIKKNQSQVGPLNSLCCDLSALIDSKVFRVKDTSNFDELHLKLIAEPRFFDLINSINSILETEVDMVNRLTGERKASVYDLSSITKIRAVVNGIANQTCIFLARSQHVILSNYISAANIVLDFKNS